MAKTHIVMLVAVIFLATVLSAESWEEKCPGDPGYVETWTKNFWSLFNIFTNEEHVRVGQNGDYVQMQLDEQCAAVYGSRHQYYTGRMSVKLKLPCGNSSGTVFAFYVSSAQSSDLRPPSPYSSNFVLGKIKSSSHHGRL